MNKSSKNKEQSSKKELFKYNSPRPLEADTPLLSQEKEKRNGNLPSIVSREGPGVGFLLPKPTPSAKTISMAFEPAGNFLFTAARKYNLEPQALAGIVCERVRKFFVQKFPEFSNSWEPIKFESGELSVRVSDAAAGSALFLHTHEIMEVLKDEDLPASIEQILIVRGN